ncbi:MAG: class I SAM-dependent methyltransferase [Flavisolibacter sp.]
MNTALSNKDLLAYLKKLNFEGGLLDRLKVYYRPVVCPFVDLIQQVKPGEKIGDIGCGSGQFCLLLGEFAKPSYIYGIEISERLVENANQLFRQNSKVPFDFETFDGISFPDKISELDLIFLNDVLHHVPKNNQHDFLKNLVAIMKPGARLIIKDINKESLLVYCNKMHDLVFAGEIGNELKFEQTRSWLEALGLKVLEHTKKRMYVYPHYTIIAKKP